MSMSINKTKKKSTTKALPFRSTKPSTRKGSILAAFVFGFTVAYSVFGTPRSIDDAILAGFKKEKEQSGNGIMMVDEIVTAIDPSDYENAKCLEVGSSDERKRMRPSRDSEDCLLDIELNEYFRLLVNTLVGLPNAGACNFRNGCQPPHKQYIEKKRRFGNDWPPYGFTMIGKERLNNFRAAIIEVNMNGIQGGVAEFGVWRGGAMIMAAAVMQNHQQPLIKRDLLLFDAFEPFGQYGASEDFLAVSLGDVQNNMESFGFGGQQNIHYVKGLFSNTTTQWTHRDDPIAVLRVDGNFYSSYQDVLYAMYNNVPVGGIIIFDDVFHHHYKEVMQCWMDFKKDQGIPEELVQIDDGSGWFRKRKKVKIDQSKKRVHNGTKEFKAKLSVA
mmetsp:Transcript_18965/g.24411  ORF Transcript_18965/g.24411 Transcript_18965/m.24411 type:complete len:386 (+) Transcript_18965:38-1195(+)